MIEKEVSIANVNKRITPHSFRRSFATNLYRKGVKLIEIRDAMGHKSVKTTELYIKLSRDDLMGIPTGLEMISESK